MKIPAWKTNRKITGMSAILLPLRTDHSIDWTGFDSHVQRTLACGLIPAVNMDTGYANLIDAATRQEVLDRTQGICAGQTFVAGAYVQSAPAQPFVIGDYHAAVDQIVSTNGLPIIFQSFGLTSLGDDELLDAYRSFSNHSEKFLAFELSQKFAPFGKIYSLGLYEQLVQIPACVGAKHSSLERIAEWQRLEIRNRVRPDFQVLTGNDLAIDMVFFGSDYLLGLSTFCPELFALRDRLWEEGDANVFELNDLLQYLGFFAFRDPVPAYKHTAAMFLHLQNCITSDQTYHGSPTRPSSDREVLSAIWEQLKDYTSAT